MIRSAGCTLTPSDRTIRRPARTSLRAGCNRENQCNQRLRFSGEADCREQKQREQKNAGLTLPKSYVALRIVAPPVGPYNAPGKGKFQSTFAGLLSAADRLPVDGGQRDLDCQQAVP